MRIREKIFALIPDTDDLPDDAAVLAQNALIALSYLYDFVLDPNPVYALYCSDKLAESVDLLHYPQGEAASDAALAREYATQLRCLSLIGAGAALGELHAFAASHCVCARFQACGSAAYEQHKGRPAAGARYLTGGNRP